MYFSSIIAEPFSTFGMATNQASFSSVCWNNANAGKTIGRENVIAVVVKTGRGENAIAVESDIKNKDAREPNRGVESVVRNEEAGKAKGDAKAASKIHLITAATALVSHWFTTITVV